MSLDKRNAEAQVYIPGGVQVAGRLLTPFMKLESSMSGSPSSTSAHSHTRVTIGGEISQDLHEAQMHSMGEAPEANGGNAIDHSKVGHSKMGHANLADANAPDSSQPVFKTLHLRPGEIGYLALAFEGIPPLIGCHIPGHYDGGMKGMVVYA